MLHDTYDVVIANPSDQGDKEFLTRATLGICL